jgi:hypothetical protein
MRFLSPSILMTFSLCLAACAPAYEDGHLSRDINRQRAARDACLSSQVTSLDDRRSAPDIIGRSASAACSFQNDRLIQLMSTMDRGGEEQITKAVRKDSVVRATSYVLDLRAAVAGK